MEIPLEKAHSLLKDPLGADEIFVSTYDHMNSEIEEFLRITYL